MLEHIPEALKAAQKALEMAVSIKSLTEQAVNFDSFALVHKDGVFHFVLLTEDQARVVNGLSIPLDGIDDIVPRVKNILLDCLQRKMDEAHRTLAPIAKVTEAVAQQAVAQQAGVGQIQIK